MAEQRSNNSHLEGAHLSFGRALQLRTGSSMDRKLFHTTSNTQLSEPLAPNLSTQPPSATILSIVAIAVCRPRHSPLTTMYHLLRPHTPKVLAGKGAADLVISVVRQARSGGRVDPEHSSTPESVMLCVDCAGRRQ